ncbi:hypothetical protein [Paenibacillus chungangensis]|uniref:Uncharacterized protein n=1 Tax=Paenibacillus chungangensis TaxID=696535 RepID=A0ABW3HKJ3_9BACL
MMNTYKDDKLTKFLLHHCYTCDRGHECMTEEMTIACMKEKQANAACMKEKQMKDACKTPQEEVRELLRWYEQA